MAGKSDESLIELVCNRVGTGRDIAAVQVAALSERQRAMLNPDSRYEQIMNVLNSAPEPKKEEKQEPKGKPE